MTIGRRFLPALAGVLGAIAIAATPTVASADTGHVVPVRLSPKGGFLKNPTTYLAPVEGAFAAVHRDHNGVTLYIHDPSGLVASTPVGIAVFNHPENCAPANTPGKHVFDPSGQQASICDPGVDAATPAAAAATGFASFLGPMITLDRFGNFRLTIPAGAALSNPRGAEVAVFEIATRHIVFASPRLHDDEGDGSDEGDGGEHGGDD